MDASFFTELEVGEVNEVLDSLDPKIGDAIRRLSEDKYEEVEETLISEFKMKDLTEARTALFRVAMDRVDHCLSQVAKARETNEALLSEEDEETVSRADKLFRSLEPRAMINRRCPKRLVKDMIELLRFGGGGRIEFPTGVMRTIPQTSPDLGCGITPDDIICLKRVAGIMLCEQMERSDRTTQELEEDNPSREDATTADHINPAITVTQASNSESDCESSSDSEGDDLDISHAGPDMNESNVSAVASDNQTTMISGTDVVGGDEKVGSMDGADVAVREREASDEYNDITRTAQASNDDGSNVNAATNIVFVDETSKHASGLERIERGGGDIYSAVSEENNSRQRVYNCGRTPTTEQVNITSRDGRRSETVSRDNKIDTGCSDGDTQTGECRYVNPSKEAHGHETEADTRPFCAARQSTDEFRLLGTLSQAESNPVANLLEAILNLVRSPAATYRCTCAEAMAGRQRGREHGEPRRDKEVPRQRRDSGSDSRLISLEEWRDSYTRRTLETEEAIVERFRNLQIENDEMAAEMRRMKRQIREMASVRPTGSMSDESNRQPPTRETAQPIPKPVRHRDRGRDRGESDDMVSVVEVMPRAALRQERPRAASFAGATTRVSGTRNRPCEATSTPMGQQNGGRRMVEKEEPKPQRGERRRGEMRRGDGENRQPKQGEKSLKEWLSKAKGGEKEKASAATRAEPINQPPVSPSWAEDDDLAEYDPETSYGETLSPGSNSDGGAAAATLRDGDVRRNVDDVYKLPPSGQVSEAKARRDGPAVPRGQKAPNYGGARPKYGGKNANGGNGANFSIPSGNNKSSNQAGGRKEGYGKNAGNSKGTKKIVTRNGWTTVPTKKRKFEGVSPNY